MPYVDQNKKKFKDHMSYMVVKDKNLLMEKVFYSAIKQAYLSNFRNKIILKDTLG